MAEPARQFKPEDDNSHRVYDTDTSSTPVTKPNLHALEGGGEGGAPRGNLHSVPGSEDSKRQSPEQLRNAEGSTTASNGTGANVTAGLTGGFWKSGAGRSASTTVGGSIGNFFWGSRRRKQATISGGGVAGIVIGAVIGFSAVSGPLELIHLSEQLKHDFTKSQSDSENRTNSLLRSWKALKTGDYRYTRVGLIGQKVVGKVIGQFEDAGVKFTGSDALGRPTGIEVDQSKVAENNPEVKDMSSEEFDSWLNDKFDVDPGTSFKDGELDIGGLKAEAIRGYVGKAGTEILGDSAAVSAVKARPLKAFFGLQSLFHPFSRAIADKIAAKAAAIEKAKPKESAGDAETAAEDDTIDDDFASSMASTEAPGEVDFDEGHDKANGLSTKIASKVVPAVGLLYGAGCTLNGVADAVVGVNRFLIVLPAAAEASQLLSMGSQIQNGGNDVNTEQITGMVRGFSNSKGQTIWSGAALQAMGGAAAANALPKNSDGSVAYDLPGEYQQAFGSSSTADALRDIGNDLLTIFPNVHLVGKCSPAYAIGLGALGTVAQALIAIANAPDADTLDLATQYAVEYGENLAISSAEGKLLGPVKNFAMQKIAKAVDPPKLLASSFKGPIGGDLIAYGARALSNTSAILNGGIAVPSSSSSTIIGDAGQEEQQQFRSESTFAKIFDVNDYRSLLGHLSMDISPSFSTDVLSGINGILNIGSTLATAFSHLIPGVAAAGNTDSWTGSYDWGSPQYGIPNNMLNDPALSDPYQNAETVGQYLSSVCKDSNGDIGPTYGPCAGTVPTGSSDPGGGYTDRIKQCFGNTLTYSEDSDVGGNVWDVTPTAVAASSDVDPNSDTYQNANCDAICPDTIAYCDNTGEENWERIVMFVNDANNIKALDCLEGSTDTSNQSCQDEGNGTQSSSTSTSTTSSTGSTIDMADLYDDSTGVACAAGTRDIGNYTGYYNDNPVPIKLCAIPNLPSTGQESNNGYGVTGGDGQAVVNSRVSGAVLAMVTAADSAGVKLTSISTFRSMAHQQALCAANAGCASGNYTEVAKPGTSNHQMGLAIDFGGGLPSTPGPVPGNAFWNWLTANAGTYGYKNYPAEAWHWSPTGN